MACNAQMAQQTSNQPAQSLASWGTGELKSANISRTGSKPESLSTTTTPLDVLLDDVKFLEAKTGLDLMTPLQEVKGVHDQVCVNLLAMYSRDCTMHVLRQSHQRMSISALCKAKGVANAQPHEANHAGLLLHIPEAAALMVQVVAALNPIAGEKDAGGARTAHLCPAERELERAHSEVRTAALSVFCLQHFLPMSAHARHAT